MIFASFEFAVFTFVVFVLYWTIAKRSAFTQNVLLLLASLFFYAYWSWCFAALFLLTIVLTCLIGVSFASDKSRSDLALGLWCIVLLAALGFFKYYNFVIETVGAVWQSADRYHLKLILPLGISFYTFMCISYVLDVRKGLVKVEASWRGFATTIAYLSFFPQIAAGPIGRAPKLLPQFTGVRYFDQALVVDGCQQFLWGWFKKVLIADACGSMTARIFSQYMNLSGIDLFCGMILYTIQIYADFSAYSDMAIGVGKMFGIRLQRNFAYPYFASNIADFWRRWHISLTTWFRDYVYIPLGGSRCSLGRVLVNTWIVFLLSGLWHGAALNFIIWGGIHAVLLSIFVIKKNLFGQSKSRGGGIVGWLLTLCSISVAWMFFAMPNTMDAFNYIVRMMTHFSFARPAIVLRALPWVAGVFVVEWLSRDMEHPLQKLRLNRFCRMLVYAYLVLAIFAHLKRVSEFIYFQF